MSKPRGILTLMAELSVAFLAIHSHGKPRGILAKESKAQVIGKAWARRVAPRMKRLSSTRSCFGSQVRNKLALPGQDDEDRAGPSERHHAGLPFPIGDHDRQSHAHVA